MQYFISSKKVKSDGKHYSYDHMRKYHDAILYCSILAKVPLPGGYKQEMKSYLDTLKKEKTNSPSAGNMSEQDADPINFSLMEWICKWAVESGLIMVWAFTCMQWNCMGRSVNIAPLGFRNLSCKEAADCIVIHYDSNKKDQKGESTSPRTATQTLSILSYVCSWLLAACYLCIYRDMFD